MKNIFGSFPRRVLFLAMLPAALMFPTKSNAATVLRTGWQEFTANASDYTGGPLAVDDQSGTAGIPGSRSYASDAVEPTFGGEAHVRVSQSATIDDSVLNLSGRVTGSQNGIYYTTADARATTRLSFDVTQQDEAVTIEIVNALVEGSDPIPIHQPFIYLTLSSTSSSYFQLVSGLSIGEWEVILPPGSYQFYGQAGVVMNDYQAGSSGLDFSYSISFSHLSFAPGFSQSHPVISNSFSFVSTPRRTWVDPIAANQFDFNMTGDSHFTQIMSFPTGFTAPFEVLVDGISLGFFGPNDSVDFTSLLGHGVSAFSVRNIVPTVDGSNPVAFPIMLDYDTDTASFTMTPVFVPEPSAWVLLLLALVGGKLPRRRRIAQRASTLSNVYATASIDT